MLVITRKPGERVVIDRDIVVEVITAHNDLVRLGITAPKEVHIVREELIYRDQREAQRRA